MTAKVLLLFLGLCVFPASSAEWVLVRGGSLPGQTEVRVDDFEMKDRPVTNEEYAAFVRATGHAPPLHWEAGRPPADMESHPVVFVNRFDVAAYAHWRTAEEGRIHRLPTRAEFEYAARAGDAGAKYPWGGTLPDGVNWDESGERTFAQWRRYLEPAGRTPPNRLGLRDMAGNVWQMVDSSPDLAISKWIYRVTDINSREGGVAGGSWARAEYYLRCGVFGRAPSGIRHPDIGFRLVREPAGTTHFQRQVRRLIALPSGSGIYLGWQLLPADAPSCGFHVYRSVRRDAAGVRITKSPVTDSTNFVDEHAPAGARVYYRVRPVNGAGQLGAPSEWAGAVAGQKAATELLRLDPGVAVGGFVPVFGDLDGDGLLDVVLRRDNGIKEMSRDPGVPVELEAFTSYGRSLWRRPLVHHDHCFGSASNVPVNVFDLDGDGQAEVIARLQEGDEVYVAVLDGMSGRVLRRTPWTKMATDLAKSSTRIHMSIAYLDGKNPAIVTQTGLYENEIIDAYDADLKHLWKYESFAETSGSGSHHIDIADLDGDGRDEVLIGTTALNPDGTLRWSIYREHPDIVAVNRFLPDRKGRQIFYAVESNVHAGAYLVDANTGRVIWKLNREDDPRWTHAHTGWAADVWDGSAGVEMMTNRDGHPQRENVLFAADGRILADPFPRGWRPVGWTGGQIRDLLSGDGARLGRFDGTGVALQETAAPNASGGGSCRMVADLAGDFRDEVVCVTTNEDGGPVLVVLTNTRPLRRREITRTSSREYRLWMARNMGGGYGSYFEWQPRR